MWPPQRRGHDYAALRPANCSRAPTVEETCPRTRSSNIDIVCSTGGPSLAFRRFTTAGEMQFIRRRLRCLMDVCKWFSTNPCDCLHAETLPMFQQNDARRAARQEAFYTIDSDSLRTGKCMEVRLSPLGITATCTLTLVQMRGESLTVSDAKGQPRASKYEIFSKTGSCCGW